MRKEDIEKEKTLYLRKMEDPDELLCACNKLHGEGTRDVAYVMSRYIISRKPQTIENVVSAIQLILISWNIAWFIKLSRTKKQGLELTIRTSYLASQECFKELEGKRLKDFNFEDEKMCDKIKQIFKNFCRPEENKGIGPTGTSKAMHIVNPELFMMWDTAIRQFYYPYHPQYNNRDGYWKNMEENEREAEEYLGFMKKSQEIAKKTLKKTDENKLWKEHLKSFKDERKKFLNSFCYEETLSKMMDEYNYIKITKPSLEEIRKREQKKKEKK